MEVVAEIAELREEADQLREAVTSHATLDQDIGMTVALGPWLARAGVGRTP
jgi:hypothetical protein